MMVDITLDAYNVDLGSLLGLFMRVFKDVTTVHV